MPIPKDFFGSLTAPSKHAFAQGLNRIAGLSQEQQAAIVDTVSESFNTLSSLPIDNAILAKRIGLTNYSDNDPVTYSINLLAMALGEFGADSEDWSNALEGSGMQVSPSAVEFSKLLIHDIKKSNEGINQLHQRRKLAHLLLPAFESMTAVVDIRLAHTNSPEKVAPVPLAIIRIDTDTFNKDLTFQVTKGQLLEILEKSKDLLRMLESAEAKAFRE